jgi:predicted MFS family arabinose efflux permease
MILITDVGWRETYLILGVLAVIAGAGMALLIENDPRDRGLGPDGDPPQLASTLLRVPGASIKEALRSRRFIGLYAACLFCAFSVFVPFVHLVPYATDHGIAPASAALLVSAIGIGSALGRFFLGGLADRLGRELSLVAMFACMAAWALSTGFWPLTGFALVFGIAYGGWVALLPAVVMDYFGGRNIGALIGILYTSAGFGTLIAPAAAGFAFDFAHSYLTPILTSGICNVIAAIMMAVASQRARSNRVAAKG